MNHQLLLEIRDSLAEIPAEQWNALSTEGNPFLRHEFLHTLDATGCLGESTGWYPRYFLLWTSDDDARELIGAVATYIKTNSYGEFVFDWSWAEAYERNNLEYYPKLVCSIPFTPATGQRLLVRADQPYDQTVLLMARAIRQFADSQKLSSVHYLFLTERESRLLCAKEPASARSANETADTDGTESTESTERHACQTLPAIICAASIASTTGTTRGTPISKISWPVAHPDDARPFDENDGM